MGEPSLAGLLAAARPAAHYPSRRALNTAANRVNGSNAQKGENSNAKYCGGLATRVVSGVGAVLEGQIGRRASPVRIRNPGLLLGRTSLPVIALLDATRGRASRRMRARVPRERPRHFEQRWRAIAGAGARRVDHAITALEPAFRDSKHLARL
jgi:hypothetical protein